MFFIGCLVLGSLVSVAQDKDSLNFVSSRKMSPEDLEKKKEGTFFTGLPEVSSDPVTGFGFGLRTNIYWNGNSDHPLFPYTPYLVKLKANAVYYTSNASEFILSLDVPYYKGSRWRFKIDFKIQQNPANLYFGLTDKTLGALSLPSEPNTEFNTFEEYDVKRKTLRNGEPGEAASLVTDALSNKFRESEFMLNLKVDYAIGSGRWRIMSGYEIQHLSYKTFEGLSATAIDPVSGEETSAPNGFSLLRRDFERNEISGLDGGWVSILQNALIYDTRDFEPDPTNGLYFEIANEYSSSAIGSEFDFDKLFVQARIYQRLPLGSRTVLTSRLGAGHIFGKNAPFFEFQDQWSPDGSVNALGGKHSLRGYRANRFLARSLWFLNTELRFRFVEFNLGKQNLGLSLAPFYDIGTVRNHYKELNFKNLKSSFGMGLRAAWNQSTIIFFDYGVSQEDRLFYFGIGQAF